MLNCCLNPQIEKEKHIVNLENGFLFLFVEYCFNCSFIFDIDDE